MTTEALAKVDESQTISGDTIQSIFALRDLLEQHNITVPIMGSEIIEVILELSESLDTEEIVTAREHLMQTLTPEHQDRLRAKKPPQPMQEQPPRRQLIGLALIMSFLSLFAWYVVIYM